MRRSASVRAAALAFGALGAFGLTVGAWADDPALRAQLHAQVIGQRVLTYAQVWQALEAADAVPGHPDEVRLVYTRRAEPAAHRDHGQNDPDSWNREHLWPKSHGFPVEECPPYTDLHHLRPADRSVNTARGERDFDEGGRPLAEAPGVRYDDDSWEVPDEVKGDVARALFYMDVRYEGDLTWKDRKGKTHREPDLRLIRGLSPKKNGPVLGDLAVLLRWNRLDPPSAEERARNDRVQAIQGNRNPFVDHPEYAARLWGN